MTEAQERLDYIMDTAAASGTLKKGSSSHMRFLRRRAAGTSTEQGDENRKPQQELTREAVEAMGIEVVNG